MSKFCIINVFYKIFHFLFCLLLFFFFLPALLSSNFLANLYEMLTLFHSFFAATFSFRLRASFGLIRRCTQWFICTTTTTMLSCCDWLHIIATYPFAEYPGNNGYRLRFVVRSSLSTNHNALTDNGTEHTATQICINCCCFRHYCWTACCPSGCVPCLMCLDDVYLNFLLLIGTLCSLTVIIDLRIALCDCCCCYC